MKNEDFGGENIINHESLKKNTHIDTVSNEQKEILLNGAVQRKLNSYKMFNTTWR